MQSKAHSLSLTTMICIVVLFCIAVVIASPAQSIFFTTLANFNGTDGANPYASLVQGTDGNFYGTTSTGGAYGGGEVFKMTPTGALTILYSFCSQPNCTEGNGPVAGLVQAMDGNFYGTTPVGGSNGYGTVFKITPNGNLTTLYSFCSQPNCADGWFPYAALVQASDGNFYGTTLEGGANSYGTVFKITPLGTLTTLHSFDRSGGAYPYAGLVQANDGNLYGTTWAGGANDAGTVFKITSTGTLTTLYNFCSQNGCTDGAYPSAGLVQASGGNFYGTSGGGAYNFGTIFKITTAGRLTTLYSFCALGWPCTDGVGPNAPLVQAADGNFYDTTSIGGAYNCGVNNCGTIFRITPGGTLTTLHNFDGSDGELSYGALVQETDGLLYGTHPRAGPTAAVVTAVARSSA